MSKAVYLGINTEFPIYETTIQEVNIPFNVDNIDSIFHTTVTGNAFIKGVFTSAEAVTGIRFDIDRDYSLANGTTVTYKEVLTALYNMINVQIFFEGAVKSGYTALKVGSTSYTITTASSQTPVFSGNITAGTTIELTGYFYYSNFMPTAGYFGITADNIADTEEVKNIVGYEQKEVARKVKNIYIGGSVEKSQYGTKLEYIECTGTQYINTGVQPTNNTRVVLDADISYNATYQALFGSRITSTVNWLAFTYKNGKGFKVDYALATANPAASTLTNSGRHVIDMNRNTFTVDGTLYHTFTTETFSIALDMYLGTINVDGTPMTKNNSSMKIYSCKIYENDELIRDFIPCRALDYEIGLFDKVNKIFYSNQGTGLFNVGTDVELIEPQMHKNIARRVAQGYVGVDNMAHKFLEVEPFNYSGDYTKESVLINSLSYDLYTLTSSGVLNLNTDNALFWMCGGGSGGGNAGYGSNTYYSGNGGGGGFVSTGEIPSGSYAVVIGPGGAAATNGNPTSIGNNYSAAGGNADGSGGSGGGGALTANVISNKISVNGGGTGAGVSTLPFGVTSLNYHCAGGGSGAFGLWFDDMWCTGIGANGGSNGSNGYSSARYGDDANYGLDGGTGGEKGGGNGAKSGSTGKPGDNGTFYGSAGGGGTHSRRNLSDDDEKYTYETKGGQGYQGVVYIAIPV